MQESKIENYLIIFLILIIIGMHAYFTEEKNELKDTIYKQHEAIKSQNELIKIYQYYYNEQQLNNQKYFQQNDFRKAIKITSPQTSI